MSARTPVAIAHDYLTQRGGAERVVLTLARRFPDAPIYTTLYNPESTFPEFARHDIRPSKINAVTALRNDHRKALPLLAAASSSIKINAEVVIASSSGWAHGFGGNHKTLVYCYSPAKWLYQTDQYLSDSASLTQRAAIRLLAPALKAWDRKAAQAADRYLAISTVVQGRIRDAYGIDADVVSAPLTTALKDCPPEPINDSVVSRGDYLLCVSRLLPYKNVDKIVSAMRSLPHRNLVVVGQGPERPSLLAMAPPNVTFLKDLTDGQMRLVYERSKGLVAASFEDFGLTPLEAALFGKPSAVLAAGGFIDTMIEGRTAAFFASHEPTVMASAMAKLFEATWSSTEIESHARSFCEEDFNDSIARHVAELRGR